MAILYALRFISGKYQGGEFPLHSDREIVIGRSSELDMVLVEDMVSRKHSKISTMNGEITIQDLGSTNGTFVNGERVTKSDLKGGDRILIGTSIIKLVPVDEETAARLERRSRESFRAARKPTSSGRPMSGTIDEIPLPDLLQLLSSSRKDGVLAVRGKRGVGRIYLRGGQIYYSSIDDNFDLNPLKAIYRILTWTSGTFELLPADDREFLEEVKEPTEMILMEGMRLLDEWNRIAETAPKLDHIYGISSPLVPKLTELEEKELVVLQLIHNFGQIQTVLDKSDYSDAETLGHIVKLTKTKYVQELQ